MIFFWAVCLHMVGDYITQTSWMANQKVVRWWPALVHGTVYTLPFLLLTQNIWALLIIGGTHAVIDHYRLAKHFIWFRTRFFEPKERMGWIADWSGYGRGIVRYDTIYDGADRMANRPIHPDMSTAPPWAKPYYAPRLTWGEASGNFGFSKDTPAWLAGWLMFITDNIIHNAINFGALYYFELR